MKACRLQGMIALITGGSAGIGESTARLFCRQGAKVVIADIQDELGEAVCRDIGPSAMFVHCDVTQENDVENAVNKVMINHGKLDIMFNNAGTIEYGYTSITDVSVSEFERVMSLNVTGVLLGTKYAARVMVPVRQGTIINTASVASIIAGVTGYGYSSSKHAVLGITKNAAMELGMVGVRVNCVSPSVVATNLSKIGFKINDTEELEEMFASKAVLKGVKLNVEDVAESVLFLASKESRYINGHNLVIDGGLVQTNSLVSPHTYTCN